ncbi:MULTISPECIES: hypothetical protein [Okeania]|nr:MULTISPECIES: hypothetical protein [Okeania]
MYDFLFNAKTSPDTDFATDVRMIMLPSKSDRSTSEKKIIL